MKGLHFLDNILDDTYKDVDLPVYLIENESDWENFYSKYGDKVMPAILNSITLALREQLLNVPIFKVLFVNTGQCITAICKRSNFDDALLNCIKYFEGTQEYEKCLTALKLINDEEEIHS